MSAVQLIQVLLRYMICFHYREMRKSIPVAIGLIAIAIIIATNGIATQSYAESSSTKVPFSTLFTPTGPGCENAEKILLTGSLNIVSHDANGYTDTTIPSARSFRCGTNNRYSVSKYWRNYHNWRAKMMEQHTHTLIIST